MLRDAPAPARTPNGASSAAGSVRGITSATTTPAADAPDVVRLVDELLADAVAARASDLHVEAADDGVRVRHRVDGVVRDVRRLPRTLGPPLVSRVKILAALDIADRLRPQDGRARVTVQGRPVELRVSVLPTARGENVVVRLQDPAAELGSLDALGLAAHQRARLEALLDAREGLVLVTGPTGSGKTTTLYAALGRVLARGGVNVVTVEDPVERRLPGVVQVQVHERAGLGFAAALRSILRQDPDVVLVGEIRDRETAAVAAQASMTGHLVLATLHTLDAAGAVVRLADLGVEPFQLAAALRGVVAQRLLRVVCAACRQAVPPGWRDPRLPRPPAGELVWRAPDDAWPAPPRGAPAPPGSPGLPTLGLPSAGGDRPCPACGGAGYRGRVAVVEVLEVAGDVARLVGSGAGADAIAAAARRRGMATLWDGGVARVRAGTTSCAELLRVLEPPAYVATEARGGHAAPAASAPLRRPAEPSRKLPDLDAAFELMPVARPASVACDASRRRVATYPARSAGPPAERLA